MTKPQPWSPEEIAETRYWCDKLDDQSPQRMDASQIYRLTIALRLARETLVAPAQGWTSVAE